MASPKRGAIHVRATSWGLPADIDFLECLAADLNGIDGQLRWWLHLSGRQPDEALRRRLRFGNMATLRTYRHHAARSYGALCAARAILAPSMPLGPVPARLAPETVTRFRRLEGRHPARLSLIPVTLVVAGPESAGQGFVDAMFTAPRQEVTIQGDSEDPCGAAAFRLWQLAGMRERDRLKRCPRCERWFVDRMKSKRKVWCSEPCHDAAWSRAQRRQAAHAQYRHSRPARGRRGGRR